MATSDLQVFLQERIRAFDETLDVTPGSPADNQIIQPVLRRLGTDPFTVDLGLFISTRLAQEFPAMATKDGDAITDLLIKPATLLWDPFVREVFRIRNGLSFRDPTILTTDEADALGANLFATRNTGNLSYGVARSYFAQPQGITFTPANFFSSSAGLHFFPKTVQSISQDEMLLNKEAELYYFDVDVVAETAGEEYNIPSGDLVTVANIASAVRVTNKNRFRFGAPEEDSATFVGRAGQSLTERSLVTENGIVAKITSTFSEVTSLASVGFNDPEMQRDVLKGGGLGAVLAAGVNSSAAADGEGQSTSRRFYTTDTVDFVALVGPTTVTPVGYVLTLSDMFGGVLPIVRDLHVKAVVDAQTLDLEEQVLFTGTLTGTHIWSLRRSELTLSSIPGGILFPNGPSGEVTVQSNEVHVGGATDILVRGATYDSVSLTLDTVTDDSPVLSGTLLFTTSGGSPVIDLHDLSFLDNYQVGDSIYTALQNAKTKGYSLQVMEGPVAGTYRVLDVIHHSHSSPYIITDPAVTVASTGPWRWKLLDELDIDLAEPKETRISGYDLVTTGGTSIVTTSGAVDFQSLGVSVNDTLRINNGPDAGDYTVKLAPLPPFHVELQLDRSLTGSTSGLSYSVFRPNQAGGVQMPLLRISSIDLLDSSGQPIGSKIPYAAVVDARSRAFANVGHGVRVERTDGILGVVTDAMGSGVLSINGLTFVVTSGTYSLSVTFDSDKTVFNAISFINAASLAAGKGRVAFLLLPGRMGITPIGPDTYVTGTSLSVFFGSSSTRYCTEIRSDATDLTSYLPNHKTDAVNVLDGNQTGSYGLGLIETSGTSLLSDHQFAPEIGRNIQFGSRSVGSARLYFLEPTSAEFGASSHFTAVLADGTILHYVPDPSQYSQKIPAPPNGTQPKSGAVTAASTLTDTTQDFVRSAILPGDELTLTYVPLVGDIALDDPVVGLHGKTLLISLDNGPDQLITFLNDDITVPGDVTRAGVATEINNAVGQTIASIDSSHHLVLEPTVLLIVRESSNPTNANLFFWTSFPADKKNEAANKGTYTVLSVTTTTLGILDTFPSPTEPGIQYQVTRPGVQRISSTEMNTNTSSAGLFYFDVELLSEGTGDAWNITADQLLTVTGYDSDGYYLTTDDSNFTFSPIEKPKLHLSRTILEIGVSDDPANATQVSGQNLQLNYDRSNLVESVNSFITADTERVICQSPLARHLIPHFVRFDLFYLGGDKEDSVVPDVEKYINGLNPDQFLEVSDLQKIVSGHGATYITNPVDLIAVVHNVDRTITLDRSQDRINTGRLAAFLPDKLNIKRTLT